MISIQKKYEGKELEQPVPKKSYALPTDSFSGRSIEAAVAREITEEIPPYFASNELVDVVEYARILQRPLLLRGDPGTGKTRLAQAVAYELYKDNYRKKYFEWFVKSTTKVSEGLYSFDHLDRLRDAHLAKSATAEDKKEMKEKELSAYRRFGPLGQAFLASKPGEPSILLIDEIDKADIDFPNDLLLELDQKRMIIPETNEEIIAEESPIIIITSNDEKDLPNAFLRRCVFHYIEFPGPEQLFKIISAQAKRSEEEYRKHIFGDNPATRDLSLPDNLVTAIRDRFQMLYNKMNNDPNTSKLPSTSELLDWVRLIHYRHIYMEPVAVQDIVGKEGKTLLFPEVLLKSLDDFRVQTNKI